MKKEELDAVLKSHAKWLIGKKDGERADLHGANLHGADLRWADLRGADFSGADFSGENLHGANLCDANLRDANLRDADLRGADLRGADLRGADLRGADLDYSAWPLWCGSLDVKIDARISAQLVYHAVRACQSVTDDDGVRAFCASPEVVALANRFHRAKVCGLIKEAKMSKEERQSLVVISCARRRWKDATKEECIAELVTCLSSCSKPSKFAMMRILELLGGHYEERKDQRRKCMTCAWMPKEDARRNDV